MAIVASFQERNDPPSKCLEFFPVTETNCAPTRSSQLDLSYIVVEETTAVMQETFLNDPLMSGDLPLFPNQEHQALQNETSSSEDFGIDIEQFWKEEELVGTSKSDCPLTGILQRQTSLKACGKLVDIVASHGAPILNLISRDKFFNERTHEASARWRKYKRAALFDSRRIILLFSILSSMGTLVLIYLTLRIRQAAETFVKA